MSWITRIKIGLAFVALLIIGGLSSLLSIRTKQRDKARHETEKAKSKADSAEKRIQAHEKRQEIENDIAIGDHTNTDWMRDPYDRG
ncbi:hypothetical protein KKJFFJLC_00028 [Vibrio phage vB_VpaS_PGB]|nr:hypothetical protein HHKILHMN_00006 [Vibrio phage vB_VpaS_PGA]WVH05571.1 hypothetical protein KKJFFJLC_00028 [Vibrio phage vB_VpaS_PGB]